MLFEKKRLLGREKLAAVGLLAVFGLLANLVLTMRSTAKVATLTSDVVPWILVKLEAAKTWSEADAYCAATHSTRLAVIEDSAANQAMRDALVQSSPKAWIGFADLQKEDFHWADVSADAYQNWDAGAREATHRCLEMLATGTWKDVDCAESLKAFFCEAPAATAPLRADTEMGHKTYAAHLDMGAAANLQCLAEGSVYDSNKVATAVRCVDASTLLCFSHEAQDTDKCYPMAKHFSDAQSICEADGRRLPTLLEATGICVDVGCGFNFFNVWATDECTKHSGVLRGAIGGHLAYAYGNLKGAEAGTHVCLEDSASGRQGVATTTRCCAENNGCDSRGIDGVCFWDRVTFAGAEEECADYGLHLCDFSIVESNCVNTGCGYNALYVRSSTVCFEPEPHLINTETPTFTCGDGCVIDMEYLNDNECDCFDCGDELRWTCDSCFFGCPQYCGEGTFCNFRTNATTSTFPPSDSRKVYAFYLDMGAAANEQCLTELSVYDTNKIATAVRCVEDSRSVTCFSHTKADADACYPMATTYAEAKSICLADGRRMPRFGEASGICLDTGCGSDHFNVWTSTSCESTDGVLTGASRGHFVFASDDKYSGATIATHYCLEDAASEMSDGVATAVRCCANDDSCDSYDASGECYGTSVTFGEAEEKCSADGQHVCDYSAVAGNCHGTGCYYNNYYVRSSTVCFDPITNGRKVYADQLNMGAAAKEQCLDKGSVYDSNMVATAVRCVDDATHVCFSHTVAVADECYPMARTYAEAKGICEADGRRVPTLEEASSWLICKHTGCGAESFNVWTSDGCHSESSALTGAIGGHFVFASETTSGATPGFFCLLDSARQRPSDGVATATRCCDLDTYNCVSEVNGVCFEDSATLSEAESRCASYGMVVCPFDAVAGIHCHDSGCDYDALYVRTKDVCFQAEQ